MSVCRARMTSYMLVCFLHLTFLNLASGEFFHESNLAEPYGLAELTRDILERIKAATGLPIDTDRFSSMLAAASSKDYETVEHYPYKKSFKAKKLSKKQKVDGGFYHSKDGRKGNEHEKSHYYEVGKSGKDGNDEASHHYGDYSGKQHKYHEGRFYKKNHLKGGGGKKGGKTKNGRKRGKSYVEKGYRDIYHKDEEKKSDFYWNNQQEEGKWIHYGLVNRKKEKSHDKEGEEKKTMEKTEGGSYEKKENKCTKCKT